MRLWHRALRRAGMPLSHSQGFNPRPRISLAAPLALGITSEAELMDVYLGRRVAPEFFVRAVGKQLPGGIKLLGAKEVWPGLPSLQSQLRFAEYQMEFEWDKEPSEVEQAIRDLLDKPSLPWQHSRGEDVHHYDLRALIDAIWVIEKQRPSYILGARLVSDASGSGRPEQVLLALGFVEHPRSIHRTRLVLGAS